MMLPTEAAPLVAAFAPAFTTPPCARFVTLLAAAVLTTGRRTVANRLRTLGPLAKGHRTDYQRVLSRAPWSGVQRGGALAHLLLQHLLPQGPVVLVGDDPVDGHQGKRVYGKARHRDPVRSSHSYTAWRYGPKWIVRAVLVRFPFANRPGALPVRVDRYRSEPDNRLRKRPPRTPAQRRGRRLRRRLIRCPGRPFVFVGDAGYGSQAVARVCHRPRARLTLVSKFCPDANRFDPPPPYAGKGRPRGKGRRLLKPRPAVAGRNLRSRSRLTVGGYGGGPRRVGVVTGSGYGYQAGHGRVPVRWVFVADRDGPHRDAYLFPTAPGRPPAEIITRYTERWNMETTFQELRACRGLESTRGWCRAPVRRAAPCLFGLYAVVAVLFQALPESKRSGAVAWPGKSGLTFSDARCGVGGGTRGFSPSPVRRQA